HMPVAHSDSKRTYGFFQVIFHSGTFPAIYDHDARARQFRHALRAGRNRWFCPMDAFSDKGCLGSKKRQGLRFEPYGKKFPLDMDRFYLRVFFTVLFKAHSLYRPDIHTPVGPDRRCSQELR
ncbi:MAG TPA: hypothetical protein P5244_13180, partial [Syntrophales bacterium]|nr:hypothetical protein [Syntrophales bacterium]